ncbi:MAG: hypothetical protein RL375_256, partial [Pseudomonadota bacterium]
GAQPGDTLDDLRRQLADHLELARGLVAAELQTNPPRSQRLVLRANGELQEAADAAAAAAALVARAAEPSDADALSPRRAVSGATTTLAGPPAASASTPTATLPSDAPPANAATRPPSSPPPTHSADAGRSTRHAPGDSPPTPDPDHRRHSAARRLIGTLEALQPLLRESDLVPRDLLDGLETHTEAWAITLDPRASAGQTGSVADAGEVIDALGQLAEHLDAFDYPQAEQALQQALAHMRRLHD